MKDDDRFLERLIDAVFDAPEARSTRALVVELIQRPIGPVAFQWLHVEPEETVGVDNLPDTIVGHLQGDILSFFSEDAAPTSFGIDDVVFEFSLSPDLNPVVGVPVLSDLIAMKLAMLVRTVGVKRLLICDCGRVFVRRGKKGTGVYVACSKTCYQRIYMRENPQ